MRDILSLAMTLDIFKSMGGFSKNSNLSGMAGCRTKIEEEKKKRREKK